MVNHHPEISPEYYEQIQDIIDNPDEIYDGGVEKGIAFVRNNDKKELVILKELENNVVFYKTAYKRGRKIPKEFKKVFPK